MKNIVALIVFSLSSLFSIAQLKESQAIDSIFSKWSEPNSPGGAIGIIKDGTLIYSKGYGLANMEYNIPNSPTSVFRIASTSKQFTAACIVLLAEQGKLTLDTTLDTYFPTFPEYASKITVRHLLNHTSGIRDYLQLAYLKGYGNDDFYSDTDLMKWLVHQTDLNFAPGEEHLYSNSGFWLLGQIVKEVAGMNMADYAKTNLFAPLGMNNTHFHNNHSQIVKNRASGYTPKGEDGFEISMTTLEMIGDGGIFTTIEDIKKWDDAFYDTSVLSTNFWKMMTTKGVLNNGEVIEYASGLGIKEYKGLKKISHGGAFVGFRAELVRFPEQRLSIAIFANRGDVNPSAMANQVADIMLKDKFIVSSTEKEGDSKNEVSKPETPTVEFKLAQLIGDYELEPGVTLSFTVKNDSLNVLQNWNKSSYNIIKASGNTYQIPESEDLKFTFSELKSDLTQTLNILQGGRDTKAARKKAVDTSKVRLEDFVGSYYSKELDVTYSFELLEGKLVVSFANKTKKMECTINEIDEFSTQLGLLRFQRTSEVISGFELDSGRVKNLKFEKK